MRAMHRDNYDPVLVVNNNNISLVQDGYYPIRVLYKKNYLTFFIIPFYVEFRGTHFKGNFRPVEGEFAVGTPVAIWVQYISGYVVVSLVKYFA